MLGQLNEIQISNLLTGQLIGRIACTDGEQNYIIPLTYTYDGNYIYGQTNEGMKLDILRKNPLVCFKVDMTTEMRNRQSAIVFGRFEELKGIEAQKAREMLLSHIFEMLTSSNFHPFEHDVSGQVDDTAGGKNVMYRIRIKKITGRFEKR